MIDFNSTNNDKKTVNPFNLKTAGYTFFPISCEIVKRISYAES